MRILLTGAGATLCMDLWALLLEAALRHPSLDYALVGRWFLGMFDGRWFHATIVTAPPRREKSAGYCITPSASRLPLSRSGWRAAGWYATPEPLIALLSGWLKPGGAISGDAARAGLWRGGGKTAYPRKRGSSAYYTHTVYGLGLLIAARLLATLCV